MMTGTTLEPSGVILDGVPSTIMLCHDAATPKPAEIFWPETLSRLSGILVWMDWSQCCLLEADSELCSANVS